jgi:hypothetical protein
MNEFTKFILLVTYLFIVPGTLAGLSTNGLHTALNRKEYGAIEGIFYLCTMLLLFFVFYESAKNWKIWERK